MLSPDEDDVHRDIVDVSLRIKVKQEIIDGTTYSVSPATAISTFLLILAIGQLGRNLICTIESKNPQKSRRATAGERASGVVKALGSSVLLQEVDGAPLDCCKVRN
jgi:hypothetical protein